jgi:hypothetical protein
MLDQSDGKHQIKGENMVVVTAAGGTPQDCALYKRIIQEQGARCRRFGYPHMVFDLGGLGFGEKYAVDHSDFAPRVNGDSLPPATFKARLVARAMVEAAPDEMVCWMDADCLPLLPFMPWQPDSWDAAVTLRSLPEIGLSNNPALDFLNSGVVWIRRTSAGVAFLFEWEERSRELNTDQGGLNKTVWTGEDVNDWKAMMGRSMICHENASVLVLDAMEWNCWHLPPHPETRILHFKRGIRAAAVNYL